METNPVLIMVINMTIVFAVLYVLGLLIRLIHIVDPTVNKGKKKSAVMSKQAKRPKKIAAAPKKDDMADKTLAAIIVTSLTAYGCKNFEIKSIKKL